MKLPAASYAVLAFAVTGCSLWDKPVETADLSLACEVTKCECRAPQSRWKFHDDPGKPVAWRSDGSAYCPEGLFLRRVN